MCNIHRSALSGVCVTLSEKLIEFGDECKFTNVPVSCLTKKINKDCLL